MLINPSINIGLSNYGKRYINSFYNFTTARELLLSKYMSFYHIGIRDDGFEYYVFQSNKKFNHNSHDKLRQVINQIYNENVNLLNLLSTEVNFNSININLIVSYKEKEAITLLTKIVGHINESYLIGSFASINLKVIGTLFEEEDEINVENKSIDLINSFGTLKKLKQEHDVLSNFILLDDKNTKAIYLGIDDQSIGFVMNEFVTCFMTNNYNLLGNFVSPDFISIGIGLVYFDKIFAEKYFKSLLTKEYLDTQKLLDKSYLISVSDYANIKKDYLESLLKNENLSDHILKFKEFIEDKRFPLNQSQTLKDIRFILSHLIGKHDDIQLKEPQSYHNYISIKEVIICLLNNFFTNTENYIEVDVIDLKTKKDELRNLKRVINDTESPSPKNLDKIETLKNEICELEEQININFKKFKDSTQYDFLVGQVVEQLNNDLLFKQKEIEKLINKKETAEKEYKKLNFFKKWKSKSNFNTLIENLSSTIHDLSTEVEEISNKSNIITEELDNAKNCLANLYDCFKVVEEKYKKLLISINQLKDLHNTLNKDFNAMNELNYMFILNLFSKSGLEKHIQANKKELLTDFKTIKDLAFKKNNFTTEEFERILIQKSKKEIKFNMINYLEGDYDSVTFVKRVNTDKTDSFIQNNSLSFINVTNEYQDNSTHQLMVCCTKNQHEQKKIDNFFSAYYNTGVPQKVDVQMPHKLGLLNIEIIEDLNHIVRYSKTR